MVSERVDTTQEMESVMASLAALNLKGRAKEKKGTPTKKKPRKKAKKLPIFTTQTGAPVKDDDEEFVYSWITCACGMSHPPIPNFIPPDGKICTYYWQIADVYPFLTLYRVLTTEIKFIEADKDESGVIELSELKLLLRSIMASELTDKTVERTFKTIDTDDSGTLDFLEVLGIVDTLIQRKDTNLPEPVKNDYSKVCAIQ